MLSAVAKADNPSAAVQAFELDGKAMNKIFLALAATASLAAPLPAATPRPAAPPAGEEASIPFAHFGGVWSFEAPDDEIVYLQDRSRNWYRAQLYGPCFGLGWANGIGIDTRGSSNFDRYSALIVGRERCQIQSLTRSGPPPRRHHGKTAS
jgi:hypothetical protein